MSNQLRAAILLGTLALLVALPGAQADELCSTITEGTTTPPTGTVNTYYPAGSNGTLVPGTIDIPVGTAVGSPAIADGDLVLIIQMQGASINSNDNDSYGDGNAGAPASGMLATPSPIAGHYEYLVARGAPSGGLLPVEGKGPLLGGNPRRGVLNTYVNADATATEGQMRYQVIRVPRYSALTVPVGGLQAEYWNGSTGGVLVVDVIGLLDLGNRTISAAGRGFRGGHGQNLQGTPGATPANYRYPAAAGFSTTGAHGNKGEGIAGTPRYVRNTVTGAGVETGAEGYPNGSRARGAPANAGGGGTDSNPSANNDSAGGGGGGNGGPGGQGGNTDTGQATGGHGGARFEVEPGPGLPAVPLWGPGRVAMGGGGGSGSKHDNSPDESGGAAGGGLILIRTGSLASVAGGTLSANGNASLGTGNDGGGGAGAGGSIIFVSKSTDYTGVTLAVTANGGRGADAGSGSSVLGPGGGGGGGVVLMNAYTNGGGIAVATTQGANGLTQAGTIPHGSTGGIVGTPPPGDPSNPFINRGDIPGADPGADCAVNDPPVAVNDGPYTTPQNTPITVLAAAGVLVNDTDPEAGALTAAIVAGTDTVNVGTVVLNPDGSFTFTPVPAFVGTAQFTYQADDGPNLSNIATVSINVGAVNDAPVNTVPAGQTINEDATLTFTTATATQLSVLDSDAGANPIRVSLSFDIVGPTPVGSLTLASLTGITFIAGANGASSMTIEGSQADINAALNGAVYAPPADFYTTGVTGPITMTLVSDDRGWAGPGGQELTFLTDTDTMALTVTSVNDLPVAADDAWAVANNSVLVTGTGGVPGVLDNDTDVEGSTLTVVLPPASLPASGLLVLNADGSFTYAPAPGFVGTVTFTYFANDGTANSAVPATVTIQVFKVRAKLRAGYCGLTGLEAFALLGVLRLLRSRRERKGS